MREIKFRAKDLEGHWRYGFVLIQYGKSTNWTSHTWHISTVVNGDSIQTFEIDSKTISQFTGLKDSQGKGIYEGDVVAVDTEVVKHSSDDWLCDEPELIEAHLTAKVVYMEDIACFDLETIDPDPYLKSWGFYGNEYPNKLKIIGNIYQNLELISK